MCENKLDFNSQQYQDILRVLVMKVLSVRKLSPLSLERLTLKLYPVLPCVCSKISLAEKLRPT